MSEPFRLFFPLGICAAVFGLLLWPMHYFGWWPVYPALQHPRILIFGFGAAFVTGFLGTAWPRFVESEPLRRGEVGGLVVLWSVGQVAYAKAAIAGGDLFLSGACFFLAFVLGRRLFCAGRELPPAGFAVAFFAVLLAALVLLGWGLGWANTSPEMAHLHRLVGYQGFLLLPILGVGSFLFPRFFEEDGKPGRRISAARLARVVWGSALLLLVSFFLEAYISLRWGNVLRIAAVLLWAGGSVPQLLFERAPGTRPWALRFGFFLIPAAFACRVIWPEKVFAFEHLLFLGGITQLMLLVADRVATGHAGEQHAGGSRSLRWRWIVWLMLLTAATRATADLVPSTRVSHHIYAALMLVIILGIWWWENGGRLRHFPDPSEGENC